MLARPRQTVVIYMGAGTLPLIAGQLMPMAAGRDARRPDRERHDEQRARVVGTLATIERQALRARLQGRRSA